MDDSEFSSKIADFVSGLSYKEPLSGNVRDPRYTWIAAVHSLSNPCC